MASQIIGLDSLLSKLDALGGDSTRVLETSIKQAVKKVQGDAKLLCPTSEGGGRLKNSIQGTTERTGDNIVGKVSTNVEYAQYVEFGTGQRGEASPSPPKYEGDLSYRYDWNGMAAQPYMYPALKQNEDLIRKLIKSNIKKAIEKVASK